MRVALALLAVAASLPAAPEGGGVDVSLEAGRVGGIGPETGLGGGASFHAFYPRLGTLRGSLDAAGGRWTGWRDTHLTLEETPWRGAHWTLRAGDFRVRTGPGSLAGGLYRPLLPARGARVEARRGNLSWVAYCGAGALRGGRLTAFRVSTGQRLCGASATLGLGEAWTVGTRLIRLDGEPRDRRGVWNAPLPLRFRAATTAAAWAAYRSDGVRLFFEGAAAGSKPAGPGGVPGRRFHGTAAAEWTRPWAGAVLAAESQGADYLPVAGAYLGDRATGRASARARPLPALELGLSASTTRSNVERDPLRPTFRSLLRGARASWSLPGNASISGTLDWLRFGGSEGEQFYTRLASVSARKDLGRHGLRAEWRELRAAPQPVPVRSLEIEDSWRPLPGVSLGGLLRWRTSAGAGGEARALDVRAFGSFSRGRWSAHASAERGRDVADDTLLARRLYSSSEFGLTGAVGGWKLSVRGGRFTRAQQLTPGAAHFLREFDPFEAGYGQWTLHVRASRAWRWGAANGSAGPAWDPIAPLVGSISGRVWSGPIGVAAPMAGVWVLVGDREAVTDADGRWNLERVPAGTREVRLDLARLPADLDPAGTAVATVAVRPGRDATADFPLRRLGAIAGRVVSGDPGMRLDQLVLRLEPGGRWTATRRDGTWAFRGLPSGDYAVEVDRTTAPGRTWRWGYAALVALEPGAELAGIVFEVSSRR